MALSDYADYEVKVDSPVTVTGKVEVDVRLSLSAGEPEGVAGTNCITKLRGSLSKSSNGQVHTATGLGVQFSVNNVPTGGELDFSSGEVVYDLNLPIGRSRISAQVIGYGLAATLIISILPKAKSGLPSETDSSVLGSGVIHTQVKPAKKHVVVEWVPESNAVQPQSGVTDERGVAKSTPFVVTTPTHIGIVCPTENIKQPERLCIIPPRVGMPAWMKKFFFMSVGVWAVSVLLLILIGGQKTVVEGMTYDQWVMNHYVGEVGKTIKSGGAPGLLWWVFGLSFIAIPGSAGACMFQAVKAAWKNINAGWQEDRVGDKPTADSQKTLPATGQQSPTATSAPTGWKDGFWGRLLIEAIAEAGMWGAEQGIRSIKLRP